MGDLWQKKTRLASGSSSASMRSNSGEVDAATLKDNRKEDNVAENDQE